MANQEAITAYSCIFPPDLWLHIVGYFRISDYATLLRLNKWNNKRITDSYPLILVIDYRHRCNLYNIVVKSYGKLTATVPRPRSIFNLSIADVKDLYKINMCKSICCEHLSSIKNVARTLSSADNLPDCMLFNLGLNLTGSDIDRLTKKGILESMQNVGLVQSATSMVTTINSMFDNKTFFEPCRLLLAPHLHIPRRRDLVLQYLFPLYKKQLPEDATVLEHLLCATNNGVVTRNMLGLEAIGISFIPENHSRLPFITERPKYAKIYVHNMDYFDGNGDASDKPIIPIQRYHKCKYYIPATKNNKSFFIGILLGNTKSLFIPRDTDNIINDVCAIS